MDLITKMALRKTEIDEAIAALEKMEVGQKKAEKGFVVKEVSGVDIHKFVRDLILPEIIELLRNRKFSIIEEGR